MSTWRYLECRVEGLAEGRAWIGNTTASRMASLHHPETYTLNPKIGKLREFKGGAFTIARKTGVKIVPVTLLGNDKVFPSNAVSPKNPNPSDHSSPRKLQEILLKMPWAIDTIFPFLSPPFHPFAVSNVCIGDAHS